MTVARRIRRPAFTLVELLVAIGIIAILAAILLPTIAAVRKKALETRIAVEINQIDKALEAYKLKHGDYPPNFFDIDLVKRHMRTAFPSARISPAAGQYSSNPASFGYPNGAYEIIPGWDVGTAPDAAECVVFWLGGLSSDARFPFTGPGGPLTKLPSGELTANPERNEGFFTFDQSRLTTYLADLTTGLPNNGGQMLSNDEVMLHGRPADENDPFPTYYAQGQALLRDTGFGNAGPPYVYFNSRSYTLTPSVANAVLGTSQYVRAFWQSANQAIPGRAAPYRTVQVNSRRNTAADTASNPQNPGNTLYYAERDRYQIIHAGLDAEFGTAMFAYNTGELIENPSISGNGYRLADGTAPDEDNITNFSEGKSLVRQRP